MQKKTILLLSSLLVLSGCMEITPPDHSKENDSVVGEESSLTGQITEVLVDQAIDYVKERYKKRECVEENNDCKSESSESAIEYVRGVDGDTVVLRIPKTLYGELTGEAIEDSLIGDTSANSFTEVTLRFLLIDTPELASNEPLAKEAKEFTAKMLEDANVVEVEVDQGPKFDHYQRMIGYIYCDGISVQEALLTKGLAKIAYVNEPNTRYLEKFKLAEEHAKTNRMGIWGLQ